MIALRDCFFRRAQGDFHITIPELTVARGEQVALIGDSGSGKTTVLHLIAGILGVTSGN